MKYIPALFISLLLLLTVSTQAFAQSPYIPVLYLTAEAQQVVAGQPVSIMLMGNTLGNNLKNVDAYISLSGDAAPQNGYTYNVGPTKAKQSFTLGAHGSLPQNTNVHRIQLNPINSAGINWGSEAVPLGVLRFVPQRSGTISAYLNSSTNIIWNEQNTTFDNYMPESRPYVVTVVGLPSQTAIPSATSNPSPNPSPTPPDYQQQYEELRSEVTNLDQAIQQQEKRLSILETIVEQIKAFFTLIFQRQ